MKNLDQYNEEMMRKFDESIENHGCSSCWSDDHKCNCEQDKSAMRSQKDFLKEALKGQLEIVEEDMKLLKNIHLLELDAISMKSLKEFMIWADSRKSLPI
jgi:hypothetical protein